MFTAIFQITSRIQIVRLIDSICQIISSKENYEDLCGDLLTIRIIAQTSGIPGAVKKQLHNCLKVISDRFTDEFGQEGGIILSYYTILCLTLNIFFLQKKRHQKGANSILKRLTPIHLL